MTGTRQVEVLVIGAGPTGIGAAVRLTELGLHHLVVEAGAGPGGMASSVHDAQGFTWDLGGHVIHSHFVEFDKAIAASGVVMLPVRRNGWVWMDGALHPAPVQQNLDVLPADLQPDAPAANLREYYRNSFGEALTAKFFQPYTFKMWAHPLTDTAHEWTSLRGGSGERNVPKLGLAAERRAQPPEFFPYPQGGSGALWTGIHAAVTDTDSFRFDTRVVAVDLSTSSATLSDGTTVIFGACVSTAPVTEAMRWLGLPATGSFVDGRPPLTSSTVHAVGFGFTGEPPDTLAGKSYLYSPDADVPWYRATMLSNYDPGNAGAGRWNVLCEVSTSAHRQVTADEAREGVRASLVRLGVDLDRTASVWTTVVPAGYPVPTLGRDEILRDVDRRLRAHGVHSRGRFGGWRYESCNQDYSFAQGLQAVDAIVDGAAEDVYWHPERF